jgi:DNA-binding NtrC family response regulator
MRHAVLLVDDDRHLLDGLRRTLRREPYEVLLAENAGEAIKILAGRAVDVVVSDEGMPGMSGTEFLAHVQAEYPDTIRIMLTGRSSLPLAIRAINRGQVYRFFTKPFSGAELGMVLRQALKQRELVHQSCRLLETVRRQAALLGESTNEAAPVWRDSSGTIIVRDAPTDLDALLAEVEAELRVADQRLAARDLLPQQRPGASPRRSDR